MLQLFPHAEYAEDQQLAAAVLTTHVLHRGIQTGATIGIATGASNYLYRLSRSEFQLHAALRSGHITSALRRAVYPTFSQTIFRHSGIGAVAGVAAVSVGLAARMRGKEQIEWQDRAWRLMHNEGQLEVDLWSLGGAIAGAASGLVRRRNVAVRQIVGRTSVGSMIGVVGYTCYRYGLMRGEKNEKAEYIAVPSVKNTVSH